LFENLKNLPFISKEEKFDGIIKDALNSSKLTKHQKDYLKKKLEYKERWAKSYIKQSFAGGVCTTSRVEGLHSMLKKYLNSNSSLQNVFSCFRFVEMTQIKKFEEEYKKSLNKDEIKEINILKHFNEKFSEYFCKKITSNIYRALNYQEDFLATNKW